MQKGFWGLFIKNQIVLSHIDQQMVGGPNKIPPCFDQLLSKSSKLASEQFTLGQQEKLSKAG